MAQNKAKIEPFDPFTQQPKMSYKDGYQKRYFALESIQDGASKIKDYAKSISRVPIYESEGYQLL